jgi:hypothetical protein
LEGPSEGVGLGDDNEEAFTKAFFLERDFADGDVASGTDCIYVSTPKKCSMKGRYNSNNIKKKTVSWKDPYGTSRGPLLNVTLTDP